MPFRVMAFGPSQVPDSQPARASLRHGTLNPPSSSVDPGLGVTLQVKPSQREGGLTNLITRLLTNPLAKSRSTADASVQSSPQARPPHRLTVDGLEGQSSSP